MSSWVLWSITIVTFIIGAFYSGSETAFLSADRIRLRHLASRGNRRASRVLTFLESPEYFLSVVLVGTNLSITACTATFTALATRQFGDTGPAIATAILVPTVLLFNEIIPKGLFLHYANRAVLVTIDILRVFIFLTSPIVKIFTVATNALTRVLPGEPDGSGGRMTIEAFVFHLGDSREAGLIAPETTALADRAISLQSLVASDVMRPIDTVARVDLHAPVSSYAEVFKATGFSRLPIYDGDEHNIVSIISVHEYVTSVDRDALRTGLPRPYTVAMTTPFADMLFEMREQGRHMAVILDAAGGVCGMVTLEDILERLVGAIADEYN